MVSRVPRDKLKSKSGAALPRARKRLLKLGQLLGHGMSAEPHARSFRYVSVASVGCFYLVGCATAASVSSLQDAGFDVGVDGARRVDAALLDAPSLDAGADAPFGDGGATAYVARMGPTRPAEAVGFGGSVALSADGTIVAVGDQSGGTNGNGAVTIYQRGSSNWTGLGTIAQPAGALRFGSVVALSSDGTVLAVGDDDGGGDQLGAVTVYSRNGNTWTAHTAIARPAESNDFGSSVALSRDGNTLAVADLNGGPGMAGAVLVYARSGTAWMSQGALVRPGGAARFGTSLSLSTNGDTLAVGDSSASPRGSTDVYVRTGNTWALQQRIAVPSAGARFGSSVMLSGDGNLLGVADSANGTQGAVSFFVRSGATWNATSAPTPAAGATFFGEVIALSANGNVLAVRDNRPANGADTYFVSLYLRSGSTWSQPIAIAAPANSVLFGAALALSSDGSVLAVGDWQGAADQRGAVTIYTP